MTPPIDHEVMLAIGRLEGKLDALIQQRMEERRELRSIEVRVRTLESSKAFIIGGAGALSALVSILGHFLR